MPKQWDPTYLDVKVLHRSHYGELATIQAKASTDRYHAPQEASVFAKMTVCAARRFLLSTLAVKCLVFYKELADKRDSICTMS